MRPRPPPAHLCAAAVETPARQRPLAALELLARALAAVALGLRLLLAALDGRLHVTAALLELAHDPLRGHHALELLDCALYATLADLDLDGFALNRIACHGSPFKKPA